MEKAQNPLPCDGCGFPASPEHIAERLRRLELSTRFRPIHIGILFVTVAPAARPEDDFYGPAESKEFFDPFLQALGIVPLAANGPADSQDLRAGDLAKLAEFQHRGCYLACLSECPIPANREPAAATIARLAHTLLRRIRFNYRPRLIAPVGQELRPLVDILNAASLGPILTLDQGLPLPYPGTGGAQGRELFRRAVAAAAPREYLSPGYDRIPLTTSGSDLGPGGKP